MADHFPPNWQARLAALLAIPDTAAWRELSAAWATAEGSYATWNPWDTTYPLPGSTDFNTDGVQDYLSPLQGLCATALTLAYPDYAGILGDLQSGHFTAKQIVTRNAPKFDEWGTGSASLLAVLGA